MLHPKLLQALSDAPLPTPIVNQFIIGTDAGSIYRYSDSGARTAQYQQMSSRIVSITSAGGGNPNIVALDSGGTLRKYLYGATNYTTQRLNTGYTWLQRSYFAYMVARKYSNQLAMFDPSNLSEGKVASYAASLFVHYSSFVYTANVDPSDGLSDLGRFTNEYANNYAGLIYNNPKIAAIALVYPYVYYGGVGGSLMRADSSFGINSSPTVTAELGSDILKIVTVNPYGDSNNPILVIARVDNFVSLYNGGNTTTFINSFDFGEPIVDILILKATPYVNSAIVVAGSSKFKIYDILGNLHKEVDISATLEAENITAFFAV